MKPNNRPKPSAQKTITDVAKRADVSISTVSRVLNHSAPVSFELEAKVKTAIAEMRYRPQTAARTLAGQRTNTIGLVFAEIGPDFYPVMIPSIEKEARLNGYNLLISVGNNPLQFSDEIPFTLGDHYTDGLLIFPASLPAEEIRRQFLNDFPMVLIQQTPPNGLQIPHLVVKNKNIACKMVDHLIEVHGCRRIAFLAGLNEHEDAAQREMGYRQSLAAHGILFDPELRTEGYFLRKESYEAVKLWLQRGVEFDAIFACDDFSAIGALSALNQAGIRVPEDVALVGFDDIEISRYLPPPLTTVAIPIEELGRIAVQQLLRLIHTGQADLVTEVETELVVRRSCGCEYK